MRILKYSLVESDANSYFCVNAVWSASVNIEIPVIDTGHFSLYILLALINIHGFRAESMRRTRCAHSPLFLPEIVTVMFT